MTDGWLPPAEYYVTRPKQMASAGALFRDTEGRVLLLATTYGDETWEIPGGGLEEGESPRDGAGREIKEELGFECQVGRLLVVDWVPPQPDGRPALENHVFDGGILNEAQIAGLRLDTRELKHTKFATRAESQVLLRPHLARRVGACLDVADAGGFLYLENGFDPLRPEDAS